MDPAHKDHNTRLFSGFPLVLILLGLIVRLLPLFDTRRLFRQFFTEGGFQILTIARNWATGLGLSTADGSIPTNGIQPLVAFVWAFAYLLVGGDKTLGVLAIHLIQIAVALASTVLLFRLCRFLVQERDYPAALPAWVAAIWFASPQGVRHTQSGLETGPYILVIIAIVLFYIRICQTDEAQLERNTWIKLGLLLGLAYWVRHDAVFLASTLFTVHLVPVFKEGSDAIKKALRQLGYVGLAGGLVVAPWLIYNKIEFGGITPVSTQAQWLKWGMGADPIQWGQNLFHLFPGLVKTALVLSREPDVSFSFLHLIWAPAFSIMLMGFAVNFVRTANPIVRKVMAMGFLFGGSLAGFYGLFFGYHWFLGHYLFPLSPILLFLTCAMFTATFRKSSQSRLTWIGRGLRLFIIGVLVWFHVQIYRTPILWTADQSYFSRADWVAEHIPDTAWVGGLETGILGYFHDKTINLNGHANPHALAARRDSRLTQYILDSNITYLVDAWQPIKQWMQNKYLAEHFKLILQASNLGVLQRKGPVDKGN